MTISMTGNYPVVLEPCGCRGPLMKVLYIMRGFSSKEMGCNMGQSMGAGKGGEYETVEMRVFYHGGIRIVTA